MDIRKTYLRSEVDPKYTWDLKAFFETRDDAMTHMAQCEKSINNFIKNYKGKLSSPNIINSAIKDYMEDMESIIKIASYTNLYVSQDNTNQDVVSFHMNIMARVNKLDTMVSFFIPELLKNDESLLLEASKASPDHKVFIQDLIRKKSITLSEESEEIISKLSMPLNSFYKIYNSAKLQDMDFPDFEANGSLHPLSYNIYEGLLENESDHELRRKSFKAFSMKLEEYKNVTASNYLAHCQKEKAMADLRGFDSVIDYLLFDQKVTRELYNRQIDIIMEDLGPIMRRYARLLKTVHGLDEIRYEDLKIDLDNDFSQVISVDKAKELLLDGLSVLGNKYSNMIEKAFDERWIDFVNNKGKSTGAFCSSPYGVHPYILISWTGKMTEAMVLGHELGHAGHFYLSQEAQNILNTRPSTYFVEAPSTTNELIMANHLLGTASGPKERRYYLSQIISRTYYHNFVTHLLEADFQRKVYMLIDEGKSFTANKLSELFMESLKDFWGDDVILTEGAELTWMRQPHYYMGLYPYTYSAGLTIGTQVSQDILNQGQPAVDRWLDTLSLGGSLDPIGLAKNAGVDITTDLPLKNTIKYIDDIVTELEEITNELK